MINLTCETWYNPLSSKRYKYLDKKKENHVIFKKVYESDVINLILEDLQYKIILSVCLH